ncbi:MAG: hypothetical protein ACI39U_00730 [Candidatus Cryptobacteroides sp.]
MRKGLIVILLSLVAVAASASGADSTLVSKYKVFRGCSGGMMLHTGWISSSDVTFTSPSGAAVGPMRMRGVPFGIGGAAKVHLWDWVRVGGEGFVSHLNYGENHSNENIGWGGLLVEGICPIGRWFPFAGVTVGGGSVKNTTVLDATTSDFVLDYGTTSYRKYAFMAVCPYVGVEFALTSKVHIVLRADCLLDVTSGQADFPLGPRIYFGFMFWR